MAPLDAPPLSIEQGTCYALFAYDIGLAINLDEAERHVTAISHFCAHAQHLRCGRAGIDAGRA